MNWIVKVALCVLLGVLVTAVLNYFNVLNTTINALLGVVVALVAYFNAPEKV